MSGDPRANAAAAFSAEGVVPRTWANQPGYTYQVHGHPYHKVLFCVDGSITFHLGSGDVHLIAGDRLDLGPGTLSPPVRKPDAGPGPFQKHLGPESEQLRRPAPCRRCPLPGSVD